MLFASIYIDRDGDGVLTLGDGAVDQIAQGADGLEATIGVPIMVVPLGPIQLAASDQESEGTEVVAIVTVPAPAFLVLRSRRRRGTRRVLAVSDLLDNRHHRCRADAGSRPSRTTPGSGCPSTSTSTATASSTRPTRSGSPEATRPPRPRSW